MSDQHVTWIKVHLDRNEAIRRGYGVKPDTDETLIEIDLEQINPEMRTELSSRLDKGMTLQELSIDGTQRWSLKVKEPTQRGVLEAIADDMKRCSQEQEALDRNVAAEEKALQDFLNNPKPGQGSVPFAWTTQARDKLKRARHVAAEQALRSREDGDLDYKWRGEIRHLPEEHPEVTRWNRDVEAHEEQRKRQRQADEESRQKVFRAVVQYLATDLIEDFDQGKISERSMANMLKDMVLGGLEGLVEDKDQCEQLEEVLTISEISGLSAESLRQLKRDWPLIEDRVNAIGETLEVPAWVEQGRFYRYRGLQGVCESDKSVDIENVDIRVGFGSSQDHEGGSVVFELNWFGDAHLDNDE